MVLLGKRIDNILVSVIVPVYNVKEYLPACIESLLCQTHFNIELIIIDDGSTDGSSDLLDKYAERDNRVSVYHTANSGLSAARNLGLNVSRGDFIMFVDGDDYVEKDFCKDALRLMTEHNVDIASFGYRLFWTNDNKSIPQSTQEPRLLKKADAIRELIKRKDIIYNLIWNKIYSRNLFDGIRFPEGRTFEDVAVIHLLFDRASTGIYVSDRVLYNYRQAREGSIITNAFTPEVLYNRFVNEHNRLQFIKNHFPNLEPGQVCALVTVCLLCFVYMPKTQSAYNEIKLFMESNRKLILSASAESSMLRRIRIHSYYCIPIVFRLINLLLKSCVYRA